jgi:hypothetical protein
MSNSPVENVSIAEHSGHIPARPVSWVVVVMVCAGFLAAGIGLVVDQPWLFFVGAGVVVVGSILGWVTHAMADVTARVETPARRANAAEATAATAAPERHAADEPARH